MTLVLLLYTCALVFPGLHVQYCSLTTVRPGFGLVHRLLAHNTEN